MDDDARRLRSKSETAEAAKGRKFQDIESSATNAQRALLVIPAAEEILKNCINA